MFEETRKYLKKLGLPDGDLFDLPTSGKTFPDGAHFRLEVPTVNSAEAVRALLEHTKKNGVTVNRIDETYGIFRHTRDELKEYAKLGKEFGCEINLSVGPRATYDTGATVQTPQGVRIGYRLRGMEQVCRAVEDIKRAIDCGIRGILIYDEGLLWLVNKMREEGELPENIHFKVSAHCGHANPLAFHVLETLGADSINPVRDLSLPMLAALRRATSLPLDLHTDNPPASGGFIRSYEAPEIVRVASPCHLKCGNSAVSAHGQITGAHDGVKMGDQAIIIKEMMDKYYPEAIQSKPNQEDMAIPEI
ncbi:MAG: peptidase [Spirochaetes bacterium]|nr:MAG: peptidase [Spirochaetota bacterium]